MRAAAVSTLVAALLAAGPALGQLGRNGQPIETSKYTIDIYEGPNLAGSRVVGLAGAYAPIAEGVAGYQYNPASPALRLPWSVDWFDWDLDGGFTLPSSLTGTDFDNNGDSSFANSAAFFLTGGGGLQFGALGVGVTADWNRYGIRSATADVLNVNQVRGLLVVGYSFFKGQLIPGLGVGVTNINVATPESGGIGLTDQQIARVTGPSFHFGAIWAPISLPLRVGASVRFSPKPSDADAPPEGVTPDENGDFVVNGIYLPRSITLPTEIHAGVAVQLFRPFNFGWVSPRDEKETRRKEVEAEIAAERAREGRTKGPLTAAEEARVKAAKKADRDRRRKPYVLMPRGKLLISAAVKVTAPTQDGVGLESFLTQTVERSGQEFSFSPRLGVEAEAIPGYVVARAGSYYEPTRFETGTPRVHATGGLDIRIPIEWSVFGLLEDDNTFRVGGSVDGTLRYFGWGVTAGLWH